MWHASSKLLLTLCVFAVGAGLGIGLKQGWLPIQFVAPPTGTIDETANADADDVDTVEQPLPEFAREIKPVPFQVEPQSEPEFAATDTPATGPRRLPIPETDTLPATDAVEDRAESSAIIRQTRLEQPALPAKQPESLPEQKSFAATLAAVETHLGNEEWLAAHKELSRLYWANPERRSEIIDRLNHTAQAIFFSPQPHFIEPHVVGSGDRLQTIANQYKLTWEYLAELNHIDPKRIRDGQRLKVIRGPFSAVVELDDFSLTVHLQGYFVKRYTVGIGKDGSSPIGKHTVLDKVVNPAYTAPDGKVIAGDDPANPLGECWINLGNSYGIHGTIEPDSIGQASSRGCIRLANEDVVEVYNFLINGSEVVIRR